MRQEAGILRSAVLRFMRVPPRPEPPPGSPPRIFRAAPNFFKLRVLRFALTRFLAFAGLVFGLYIIHAFAPVIPGPAAVLMEVAEVVGWIAFAFHVIVGYMVTRLDYELRWYLLSDRAIRIREGIVTVREKTIALANVQNIAIRQGPLQRVLGIADVEVKTAGGGGESGERGKKGHTAEPLHIAYFRGVANANEIRDLVREGVRRQRDAGLGDPDDHHHAPPIVAPPMPHASTVRTAVAELHAEARALRAVSER
jgi:membrane protein YdbS with pleckstrin-like domain